MGRNEERHDRVVAVRVDEVAMAERIAGIPLVAVQCREALRKVVHVRHLLCHRIPEVGASGLVVRRGAEVHFGGIDHVAVELRKRSVAHAAHVLGELGVPVKVAPHDAQRLARVPDPVVADEANVVGLGGMRVRPGLCGLRPVRSQPRRGSRTGEFERTGDHPVQAGPAGKGPATALVRPECPEAPLRDGRPHAGALARPAEGQRDGLAPALPVQTRQEGLPVRGRPVGLPAVPPLEGHPEVAVRVEEEPGPALACRPGRLRVAEGHLGRRLPLAAVVADDLDPTRRPPGASRAGALLGPGRDPCPSARRRSPTQPRAGPASPPPRWNGLQTGRSTRQASRGRDRPPANTRGRGRRSCPPNPSCSGPTRSTRIRSERRRRRETSRSRRMRSRKRFPTSGRRAGA